MNARRVFLALTLTLTTAWGCASILGLDDDPYVIGHDDASSAAPDGGGGDDVASSTLDSSGAFDSAGDTGRVDAGCDTENDPNNCGRCGHRCATGACEAGACAAVLLASGQSNPSAIAVDDGGIFWLTSNAVVMCPHPACPDAGPTAIVSNLSAPSSLAIDDAYVYWSSPNDGTIARCARAGCTDGGAVLATGTRAAHILRDDASLVWSHDADGGYGISACTADTCASTTKSLWNGFGPGAAGLVAGLPNVSPALYFSLSIYPGGGVTGTCVQWCDPLSVQGCMSTGSAGCTSNPSLTGLTLDDAAAYFGGPGGVYSCPLGYCTSSYPPAKVTARDIASPLVVRDGTLYFAGASDTVHGCAPSSCAQPDTLSAQAIDDPSGLAADDRFVYVTDRARGRVWKLGR